MSTNLVTSISEDQLKESIHYGPVTALKFLDEEHILIGYGPFLKLLRVDKVSGLAQNIWQERIFKRNKIHCISVVRDRSAVAVAGGRSFAIVDLKTKEFHEKAINEWIIAIDYAIASELLILSSHNEVLQVKVSNSGADLQVFEKIHCNEKSILYSGSIQRCNDGHVYIAAGTVMSGVLIWDLHTREILNNFTDHEGSIFAVNIDIDAKYVISCSDDRSIKIFCFTDGKLLASGWGHGSRIWSLSFYEISDTQVKIFSTGEDCSARLWSYDVNSTVLKQMKCFDNCHEGKHVWSGDAESQHWQSLVTGGADGKVRLLDVSDDRSELTTFDTSDIEKDCAVSFQKKEVIKQFVRLSNINGFVAITNHGRVLFHTKHLGWNTVAIPEEQAKTFREFSILRSFSSVNYVMICSRTGEILVLGFSESSPQPVHLEIVANTSSGPIKVINVLAWSTSDHLILLLISPVGKFPLLAKEFTFNDGLFSVSGTHELQNPDPRAFSPTSLFFDPAHHFLLVGSRHANFVAYNLSQNSPVPPYLIRKICSGDTVTSISSIHSTKDFLVVLVTVRDGVYMMVKFSFSDSAFYHEIIYQNKFTKGFIEGSFYEKDQLFLYGFRSGSFFIWNETQQLEVDHEPCGGAHRQWEFLCKSSNKSMSFSFIRNSSLVSKVIYSQFDLSHNGLLSTGTHGREIRSLALCPAEELDGSKLFVSASEDAAIKIGFISRSCDISYKWTMNSHVSGLQAVHFLNKDFLASSAANEELIVWRLNRDIPNNIAVTEIARIQPTGENPDLRVMDIASIESDDGFFIAAGFSNSQIKIFYFSKSESTFSIVAEDLYSTFCILNVELINAGDQIFLIAGTTDGVVTIWDVSHCFKQRITNTTTNLGVPKIKQQFHQSGVKALLVIPLDSNSWRVITGGDDNSLVSAKLSLNGTGISISIDSFSERAASATITGIAPVEENSVVVTSVDQIVRKWNYREGLVCSAATYTTVADTGCCVSGEFDGKYYTIVGGAGLSIFDL